MPVIQLHHRHDMYLNNLHAADCSAKLSVVVSGASRDTYGYGEEGVEAHHQIKMPFRMMGVFMTRRDGFWLFINDRKYKAIYYRVFIAVFGFAMTFGFVADEEASAVFGTIASCAVFLVLDGLVVLLGLATFAAKGRHNRGIVIYGDSCGFLLDCKSLFSCDVCER